MTCLTIASKPEKSASLRVDFSADNNGKAFARNYNGTCTVKVVGWPNGQYTEYANFELGRCRTQASAWSIGRRYIRENNLRETWQEFLL
jgi:hypothetical protein